MKRQIKRKNIFIILVMMLFFLLSFCACSFLNSPIASKPSTSSMPIADLSDIAVAPESSDELIIDCIPALGGDSFLLINSDMAMLIDAGIDSAYPEIDQTLKAYDIDFIDIVIITHPHKDHIGGMQEVIDNYDIGTLYMIDYVHDSDNYNVLITVIDQKNVDVVYAKAGMAFTFGDAKCLILNPQQKLFKDVNNNSIVLKLTYQNKHFLFTGDMEKKAEKVLMSMPFNLKSDFLKVGHHGKDDASGKRFLNAVSPQYALIPSKNDDTYEKIMNRLEENGVDVAVILDGDHMRYYCKDGMISYDYYDNFTY